MCEKKKKGKPINKLNISKISQNPKPFGKKETVQQTEN